MINNGHRSGGKNFKIKIPDPRRIVPLTRYLELLCGRAFPHVAAAAAALPPLLLPLSLLVATPPFLILHTPSLLEQRLGIRTPLSMKLAPLYHHVSLLLLES